MCATMPGDNQLIFKVIYDTTLGVGILRIYAYTYIYILVFGFQDRVSLCSSGCPGTESVD